MTLMTPLRCSSHASATRATDAGFDVDEVRADAMAVREKLERSVAERRAKEMEAQARVRSLRPQPNRPQSRRVPGMVWFVAATVGAAAAGGVCGTAGGV